jgi:hypothetical protein
MFWLRNVEREHLVEGVERLRLSYADTGLGGVSPYGAGGISYRRPTSVTVPGTGDVIPIRDHVMVLRLAVLILLLVLGLRGRRHDR